MLAPDAAPLVAGAFGWATRTLSSSVVHDGTQFRMYFIGERAAGHAIGLATSPDGRTFTAAPDPVFPPTPSMFTLSSLVAYRSDESWQLVFSASDPSGTPRGLGVATNPDGLGPFVLANSGKPILQRGDCSYCDQLVWFPSILRAKDEWLMFFNALRCNNAGGGCLGFYNVSLSIARASSTNGLDYIPLPAPVVTGDVGGEQYLSSPKVVIDGSIYKMWYAYTKELGFLGDPCGQNVLIASATPPPPTATSGCARRRTRC